MTPVPLDELIAAGEALLSEYDRIIARIDELLASPRPSIYGSKPPPVTEAVEDARRS